jgi:hypothetical protein
MTKAVRRGISGDGIIRTVEMALVVATSSAT